jgi:hypothetical protein
MQQYINDMLVKMQEIRKDSIQFSLGDIIERLKELPQDIPILLGEAESYRGYYTDLSFNPLDEPRTVKEALKEAEKANGSTFEGYKGGDFTMARDTPVWFSHYGDTGTAIIGITDEGEIEVADLS